MAALDVTVLMGNVWPILHASSGTDAVFVTDAEVTQYFDDWVKRNAQMYGCFITRNAAGIVLATGTQIYSLPARHLSTLHVAYQGEGLLNSSTKELEMRDDTYQTTAATVQKPVRYWFSDKIGLNEMGFYPVPAAGDNGNNVELIFHQYPAALDAGHSNVAIPAPAYFGDLLEFQVVGECYRKESDFEIPETAAACEQIASIYTQAMMNLFGAAQ